MNRNIEDTIKKITLSIIQFDSDIKTGNPEGITNFLSIINTYKDYFSLRVPDKHEEKILFSNFKKEIQDVFTDLFVNDKIFEVAESLFIKNGVIKIPGQIPMEDISPLTEICKISMELSFQVCKYDGSTRDDIKNIRWEKNPLYKLSDEEFEEILIKKESGIRYFKKFDTNPFKEFVSKYQDLYNRENEPDTKEILSLQELALICVYERKIIKRDEGKLYIHFSHYSDRTNRIGIETTRKKTSNKIKRIEKIISHLSKSAQQTAIDEVNTLKSALEKETF